MRRVAIAIPAYNAAATMAETLEALQRNPALDDVSVVVVLDDCSDDGTPLVAYQAWRSQVPLEVWSNAENMGERHTTNEAINRLAGRVEWTFILHADDVVKPNWLSLYFEALDTLPACVASVCSSYDSWWPDSGKISGGDDYPNRPAEHIPGTRASVIGTIERGCWWHLSGCAIRNRSFLEVGGFLEDLPQLGDWEWLLRCLSKGYGIWYVPQSTMLYRQHSYSVSSRSFREARDVEENLRILKLMRDQSYLEPSAFRSRVKDLLASLVRRSAVRLMRLDPSGVQKHISVLIRTARVYATLRA